MGLLVLSLFSGLRARVGSSPLLRIESKGVVFVCSACSASSRCFRAPTAHLSYFSLPRPASARRSFLSPLSHPVLRLRLPSLSFFPSSPSLSLLPSLSARTRPGRCIPAVAGRSRTASCPSAGRAAPRLAASAPRSSRGRSRSMPASSLSALGTRRAALLRTTRRAATGARCSGERSRGRGSPPGR